jgi:hypothetical protein
MIEEIECIQTNYKVLVTKEGEVKVVKIAKPDELVITKRPLTVEFWSALSLLLKENRRNLEVAANEIRLLNDDLHRMCQENAVLLEQHDKDGKSIEELKAKSQEKKYIVTSNNKKHMFAAGISFGKKMVGNVRNEGI